MKSRDDTTITGPLTLPLPSKLTHYPSIKTLASDNQQTSSCQQP